MKIYNIAENYTKSPGIRTGKYSGEDFREKILKPLFLSLEEEEKLTINLDGGFGYPSSFLDEAFAGLVRVNHFNKNEVLKKIKFISEEEKGLPKKIEKYISEAEPE